MHLKAAGSNKLLAYVIVLFLLTLLARIVLICYEHPNYGGLDMNVIYGVQRLLAGQPLYQDPSTPSYAIIQYTPLFYECSAAFARLLNIRYDQVAAVYRVTRIAALLCNFGALAIMLGILRCCGLEWKKALIYSLPLLLIVTMEYYTRPDSMHLLFFVAAMYASLRMLKSQNWLWLLAAALFAACSVMSKQSGALAIGIIGFHLFFIRKQFLRAIIFGLMSVLFIAGLIWLTTSGDWLHFYQNAYLGLKNGIGWDWLYTIFISQFYYDLIPCYFLGGMLVYAAFRQRQDPEFQFIATGAALSFLFAVITGLKIGSGNNYFTEFIFFVLCGLPLLLRSESKDKQLVKIGKYSLTLGRFGAIAFFILISSKTVGLTSSIFIERWVRNKHEQYMKQEELSRFFKDSLHIRPGQYVYCSEREFMDNLFFGYGLLPTKDVTTQVYRTDPKTFDYAPLIQNLSTGAVQYVVTKDDQKGLNPENEEIPFMHFDDNAFEHLSDVAGYSIYQLKEASKVGVN
jgi:hypothetical protein